MWVIHYLLQGLRTERREGIKDKFLIMQIVLQTEAHFRVNLFIYIEKREGGRILYVF